MNLANGPGDHVEILPAGAVVTQEENKILGAPTNDGVSVASVTHLSYKSCADSCTSEKSAPRSPEPRTNKMFNTTPTVGSYAQITGEARSGIRSHDKPIGQVQRVNMKGNAAVDSVIDLVLTPREEKKSEKTETEQVTAATGFYTRRQNSSEDRSGSESGISYYKPPSVEERLRLIMEERNARLEKMQQKLVHERGNIIAPRPMTLTRRNNGRLRAIAQRPKSDESINNTPLPIQYHRNGFLQGDTLDSNKRTAACFNMLSKLSEQRCAANVVEERRQRLKEERDESPMEIDKDD